MYQAHIYAYRFAYMNPYVCQVSLHAAASHTPSEGDTTIFSIF